MNLNEDYIINRKIFFDLSKNTNAMVGRKKGEVRPLLELNGAGIQAEHAIFKTSGNSTVLVPQSERAYKAIYINGDILTSTSPVKLKPNDRVIFGSQSVFIYKCKDAGGESMSDDPEISFEFAMKEKLRN